LLVLIVFAKHALSRFGFGSDAVPPILPHFGQFVLTFSPEIGIRLSTNVSAA